MPRLARIDARPPAPEVQLTRPPRLKPCDAGLVAGWPARPACRPAGRHPVYCITQGNNHQLIEYIGGA